jgi:predicted nucleotidyltransferase
VLLVGSQANGSARPDSDIDVMLICTNPAGYIDDPSWAAEFGSVRELADEDWGAVRTIRAFYAGGTEIEFNFAEPSWLAEPLDAGTQQVLQNGYRVIYEQTAA